MFYKLLFQKKYRHQRFGHLHANLTGINVANGTKIVEGRLYMSNAMQGVTCDV
jgi:hypothetical protein